MTTSRSDRPGDDDPIIDLLDGEEIPLPPPLRPCEDGLVPSGKSPEGVEDPIDWRRDRDEDRERERERWDEGG
jgi:hypothetical protein